MGSVPEWQKFFRSVAKPQDSFQDGASAQIMVAHGWLTDLRLPFAKPYDASVTAALRCNGVSEWVVFNRQR